MKPAFKIGVATAAVLLASCDSYTPMKFPTQPGEMGEGPGLFSGKSGEFVILAPSRESDGTKSDQAGIEGALPPAKPPAGYKSID